MIISIGKTIMAATVRKFFIFVSLNPALLITRASNRDVVILDTSAGWKRTGPNVNQDLEPLTSSPKKITAIRSPMTNT
ncbi:unknown [Bacteroides sp. CAG:770]|nr:unknown [Bacteroides sp. CAG:770]